jgi:hypothetical protein
MENPGSGGHNRKRVSAEDCVRIDAGMIRRAGLFDNTGVEIWTFSDRQGQYLCDINVYSDRPGESILLNIQLGSTCYRQQVHVSHTACHYGKQRPWLHCPLCERRCFRLYYYPNTWHAGHRVHFFACRLCRELTYNLRRERGFYYQATRAQKYSWRLREKESWDRRQLAPRRPKGMHRRTYNHLVAKWWVAHHLAKEAWIGRLHHLLGND